MLKDITLGQFFPGKTPAHRLDPRTKIVLTFVYIIALFFVHSFTGYAFVAVTLLAAMRVSRVKPRAMINGLRPLVLLIAITAFINAFFTAGDDVIFRIGFLRMTWDGLRRAAFMLLRVVFLVCGSFLLTYTTAPLAITDGLERLLSPLEKLRFPAHDLAMIMSIALRFIPTLIGEADKIVSAQRARGASFDTGSIVQRAKALLPLLIPLFVSALTRATELATAMECRCYNGGDGRTRLHELHFTRLDAAAALLGAVFVAVIAVMSRLRWLV